MAKNMENKKKIKIQKIIFILAIAFLIAGQFSPLVGFSSEKMREATGESKADVGWCMEYYLLGVFYHVEHNELVSLGGEPTILDTILFLWVIPLVFQSNDIPTFGEYQFATYPTSVYFIGILCAIMSFFIVLCSFYFLIKSLKTIGKIKSKYPLYAGTCLIIPTVLFVMSFYIVIYSTDYSSIERVNYIYQGYGLVYISVSAILLFITYYFQKWIVFPTIETEKKEPHGGLLSRINIFKN
jgi:hypothetical protein